MNSDPPEWDKVIDPGPLEVNLSPPGQDKVTKYPTVPGMNSGPPERDKATNSGPPEVDSGPPKRDKVTSSGANSGPLKRDKIIRRDACLELSSLFLKIHEFFFIKKIPFTPPQGLKEGDLGVQIPTLTQQNFESITHTTNA